MAFRATFQEVATLLTPTQHIGNINSGARGVAVDLDTLNSGEIYFDLNATAQQAFDRGASMIVTQQGVELNQEAREYSILVQDPASAFWELFRWWRTKMDSPVVILEGADPLIGWFEQVVASALLSFKKGCFRSSRDLSPLLTHRQNEHAMAACVMNSEDESLWYLIGLEEGMSRLRSELEPDLVIRSAPSKEHQDDVAAEVLYIETAQDVSEELAYMDRGKFAYVSDEFSITPWIVPDLRLLRALRFLPKIAERVQVEATKENFQELGNRFFAPPAYGFHVSMGEVGDLWTERKTPPDVETLKMMISDNEGVCFALITDSLAALKPFIESSEKNLLEDIQLYLVGTTPDQETSPDLKKWVTEVKSIPEAIRSLVQETPLYAIAYIEDDTLAEGLFQKRDELYTLANMNFSEGETP